MLQGKFDIDHELLCTSGADADTEGLSPSSRRFVGLEKGERKQEAVKSELSQYVRTIEASPSTTQVETCNVVHKVHYPQLWRRWDIGRQRSRKLLMSCVHRTQLDMNLRTKIRKCVPTKRNRETNAAFRVLFETCWDRVALFLRTDRFKPWFCVHLDFYAYYTQFAFTRPLGRWSVCGR